MLKGGDEEIDGRTTTKSIYKNQKPVNTIERNINKMKKHPSKWEHIFTNDAYDKRLMSKIYEKLT